MRVISLFALLCGTLLTGSHAEHEVLTGGWTGPNAVRIGALLTRPGRWAGSGDSYLRSFIMWQEHVHRTGGIKIGELTYGVTIVARDVGASTTETHEQATLLANGTMGRIDAFMAPFSSTLTPVAALATMHTGKPILACGSLADQVFECTSELEPPCTKPFGRRFKHMISMLGSGSEYLTPVVTLAKMKQAKTAALLSEPLSFNRGVAASVRNTLRSYNMSLLVDIEFTKNVTLTSGHDEVVSAIKQCRDANVDIILGATYADVCFHVLQQTKELNYLPKEMGMTLCVGSSSMLDTVGDSAKYIVGPTSYHYDLKGPQYSDDPTSPIAMFVPNATMTSPHRFRAEAIRRFGAAATSGALGACYALHMGLVFAKTLEGSAVIRAIEELNHRTFMGPIRFGTTGRISTSFIVQQYNTNSELEIVSPLESASLDMIYPIPSYDYRDCVNTSRCVNGYCAPDGSCVCTTGWEGSLCDSEVMTGLPMAVLVVLIIIGLVVLVLSVFLVRVYLNFRRMSKLYSGTKLAADLAESIADMDLDSLEYLGHIEKPNNIQVSFISILNTLKYLRAFIPDTFNNTGDEEGNDNASDATGRSSNVSKSETGSIRGRGSVQKVRNRKASMASSIGRAPALTQKSVTVLVVEARGFHDSTSVADYAAWLEAIIHAIQSSKGVLLSFQHGLVMAFWSGLSSAIPAATAALQCKAIPCRHDVCVGLDSGTCFTGNVGKHRISYNILGSVIPNVTSLARMCKFLHASPLMTHATYDRAQFELKSRKVDLLQLPSQATPAPVYQVMSKASHDEDEWMYQLESAEMNTAVPYDVMWKLLEANNQSSAIAKIQELLQDHPADKLLLRLLKEAQDGDVLKGKVVAPVSWSWKTADQTN
eukprot:NODE_172_length_3058_cov_54.748552_g159_i0.p1 GENE.NODE_172_length_3058_cov_54.748552_g159_i0~~NODE_172_length_3058_cov_54.748552_g159_i0.p1  ORF type:complete len:895 (-),score=145.60 NODE_172_length_3058_cov_54.748552_g159_i0:374-3004(-)